MNKIELGLKIKKGDIFTIKHCDNKTIKETVSHVKIDNEKKLVNVFAHKYPYNIIRHYFECRTDVLIICNSCASYYIEDLLNTKLEFNPLNFKL